MSKLQFTVNAEHENELEVYMKANDMRSALVEFADKLRALRKHGLPAHVESPSDAIDHVIEEFYNIINAYEINLHD